MFWGIMHLKILYPPPHKFVNSFLIFSCKAIEEVMHGYAVMICTFGDEIHAKA